MQHYPASYGMSCLLPGRQSSTYQSEQIPPPVPLAARFSWLADRLEYLHQRRTCSWSIAYNIHSAWSQKALYTMDHGFDGALCPLAAS